MTVYIRDTQDRVWSMSKGEFRRFRAAYQAAVAASQEARRSKTLAGARELFEDLLPASGEAEHERKKLEAQ